MSIELIEDRDSFRVVMVDSVTGRAFGPIMENKDEADRFLSSLGPDPREVSIARLEKHLAAIREIEEADEQEEREGELMDQGATAEEAHHQARGDLR